MAGAPKTQKANNGKAYQLLPVTDLSAGLDLRSAQTLLPSDRARTLVNWSLEQPGALVVRPGFLKFSTGSLGSGRPQGGQRVYLNTALPSPASTAFTLLAWNGGVYNVSDSGGGVTSTTVAQLTGLSTVNDILFPHDRDLVAVMDGSTTPWKSTNGSSWTKMGLLRPTSAPTLSSGSTSQLSSGEYEVSYTYKDRDLAVESNGHALGSTIYLGGLNVAINVVVPNSTEPAVDAIVIYARSKSNQEAVRRKVSSLAQSTGANSTYIILSSNWTSNDEEPTDHNPPPVLSFGVVWKNRWWARSSTVKNRIHFTQLFQAQSWPALFYLDIPFERGDEIRAMVPLGDTLIIFGTTRIFVLIGQTSLDFEVRPTIDSQDGAFGPFATTVVEAGVVHAGANGIFIYDGASDKYLSFDIEPGWRDLIKGATVANLQKIAICYDGQRKEVRVSVPRRYPSGTFGEWVLDLNRTRQGAEAWTETDRSIGGYILWNGPERGDADRGRLFSWHSSMAMVFEESTGTTANSSAMVADYEGPGLTLGNIKGRWIDTHGEFEPHAGNFVMEALIDGVSQGPRSINIGAQAAVYGTGVYGTAVYANAVRKKLYLTLPLGAEGRTLVQKATYTGLERFVFFTYTPGLVPETRIRDWSE